MRSASRAAVLMRVSAWVLPRIGTYSGSKSRSRSTPSLLLGRSMMWPFEATTVKPRPRNLVSVRDLVGDSTITSDLEPSLAGAPAARFGPGALRPAPRRLVAAFPVPAAGADSREVRREARFGVARASGSAFLSAAGARDLVAAAALLVREVEFAMTRLQPLAGIVDLERHPGGHVAGQIHAHRTDAATAEEVERALEVLGAERAAAPEVEEIAPRLGAQGLALLGAQDPMRLLARSPQDRRRRRRGRPGQAAENQDRRLHLLGREVGLLDRLSQGLERRVVALEEALEAIREQAQQPGHAEVQPLVGHHRVSTPSSMSMWHFLYFLPLPHGQGSLRPTRGPVRTGSVRAAAGSGPSPARPEPGGPAARAPPNGWASACCGTMRRGAGRCSTAGGPPSSCTRSSRCTKSSRTSRTRVSNSV